MEFVGAGAGKFRAGGGIDYAEKGVASADGELAVMIVDQRHAGGDLVGLDVVIQIPLGVGARAGFDAKAGNDGSEAALRIKKGNASEIGGGGKDISLAGQQCAAEGGIEEIFLTDFPTQNLSGAGGAGLSGVWSGRKFPGHGSDLGDTTDGEGAHGLGIAVFDIGIDALGVEAIDDGVFDLAGVGENVGG